MITNYKRTKKVRWPGGLWKDKVRLFKIKINHLDQILRRKYRPGGPHVKDKELELTPGNKLILK